MYCKTRDEEVAFLKKLWTNQGVTCPKCGLSELTYLHKKAKKSNTEWLCPSCGEIYRTIRILKELNDE